MQYRVFIRCVEDFYVFPDLCLHVGELRCQYDGARPFDVGQVLGLLILNILAELHIDVFHSVGKAVA